ncbi:MAG TPA: toprim domain-containing protein [Ktedonobacteraceae bacterium]
MLTVLDMAEVDTRLQRKSFREDCGPCPNPDCYCKHDGFTVKHDGEGKYVFMCRGCWNSEDALPGKDRKRGWGNDLQYLCHIRKMLWKEAVALLVKEQNYSFDEGIELLTRYNRMTEGQARDYLLNNGATGNEQHQRAMFRSQYKHLTYKDERWQQVTHEAMEHAITLLWSEDGIYALNYARSRGFPDEMIKMARMGFSVKNGIPRLLIPSIVNWHYVTVYRRDLRENIAHEDRWRDIAGGSHDILYGEDCLSRKLPTVLHESAIDALSTIQAYGDDWRQNINAVATSGLDSGRNDYNLALLVLQPLVLVAFDADKAGDKMAQWWLKRLPNARRLRPLLHDVNDMLVGDWDIKTWVDQAIYRVPEVFDICPCGISVEYDLGNGSYTENGKYICSECASKKGAA